MSRNEETQGIIRRHVLWSLGAGLIPVPVFDIAAVTAIQVDMLRQLANHYQVGYSQSGGKAFVAALTGGTFARIGASLVKAIPGVGSVVGGVSMSVMSDASTYAVGQVANNYFAKRRESIMQQAQKDEKEEKEEKEVQEDLAHGQIVIITFRWIMIIGGVLSTLWGLALEEDVGRQAGIIFLLLVYAVVNFILLTRYLRRSLSATLTYSMSLVDLILITVVIAIQGPNTSHAYVYYYPALMVLAVAFPTGVTAPYTVGAITVYGLLSLFVGAEFEQIFSRLLMMAAVTFCGSLYRQIEHNRRTGKATLVSLGGGGPGHSS